MVDKATLRKVEYALEALIEQCQSARQHERTSPAYAKLVEIESKSHDFVKDINRLINEEES